jgi:hypothetical protein
MDIGIGSILGAIFGIALGDDSIQSWHWMVGAAVLAFIVIVLYWLTSQRSSGRTRSISFSSSIMADGSWPKNQEMSQPIINAVVTFDTTPTIPDIKKLVSFFFLKNN